MFLNGVYGGIVFAPIAHPLYQVLGRIHYFVRNANQGQIEETGCKDDERFQATLQVQIQEG
ncbi:hypothetical protein JL09_g3858 [Pichia kudriavzevii]|uniref:Uncharacterized protein n=1 Tax=Pichia kudriavzevii TaxID=4909 RepID=A0A099NYI5_PICKU|nr:hypothetical protein JL09_g3858 [Pichia kudriavzevii]